jgi:hypothetical protein
MIYPGAESSIRFEKMREGIVDYEKIKLLKVRAAKSTDPAVRKLLQELNQHLQVFTAEKEFDKEKLKQDVQKGKMLVNDLSEKLKN